MRKIAKRGPSPKLLLVMLAISFSLSSCANFNCTRLEPYLGDETDLITFAYSIADDLTQHAYPRLMQRNPNAPLLVTTFVDNNDLTKTSVFGRIVQEHIRSRLVQLHYAVADIKMTGQLLIEPRSGESMLSRELTKLNPDASAQAVVVGTISHTERTMYVSARLVNPVNNAILASNDYKLCMDRNILSMFGLEPATRGDDIAPPSTPWLNAILY